MYLHKLSLISIIHESFSTAVEVPIFCKTQAHPVCSVKLWLLPVPSVTPCPVISVQFLVPFITLWPCWHCQICADLLFLIQLILENKSKPQTKQKKPKTNQNTNFDDRLHSLIMKSTDSGGIWKHLTTKCLNASICFYNMHSSCHVARSAYLMFDLQASLSTQIICMLGNCLVYSVDVHIS